MTRTKLQMKNRIKEILSRGKPINDIIFMSVKMGIFDIAFMLLLLRPTKVDLPKPWLIRIRFGKEDEYGWSAKDIYDMAENPVLTGGGDGLEQLVFGCIAALEVYTEDEIVEVLETRRKYLEVCLNE